MFHVNDCYNKSPTMCSERADVLILLLLFLKSNLPAYHRHQHFNGTNVFRVNRRGVFVYHHQISQLPCYNSSFFIFFMRGISTSISVSFNGILNPYFLVFSQHNSIGVVRFTALLTRTMGSYREIG